MNQESIKQLKGDLEIKNDLEWLDAMSTILTKRKKPTTKLIENLLGTEKPNPKGFIRGSKFIDPFDKRFELIYINPILKTNDVDQPLDYLGFKGNKFKLKFSDVYGRFSHFKTQINTYDGGTQFFFYPVPDMFEFSAIDFWTEQELDERNNNQNIIFEGIAFRFGDVLSLKRDGYSIKR